MHFELDRKKLQVVTARRAVLQQIANRLNPTGVERWKPAPAPVAPSLPSPELTARSRDA